jgi:hypothetical protein
MATISVSAHGITNIRATAPDRAGIYHILKLSFIEPDGDGIEMDIFVGSGMRGKIEAIAKAINEAAADHVKEVWSGQ